MSYPSFYDEVEPIKLRDPLADLLGTFEDGRYEITYKEVVKAAGHSCPTVAGAYLITEAAIKALFEDGIGVRGEIKVEFKEKLTDGVAGVIGNVISHITGATDKSGFKGLGGKFARHSLMFYEAEITSSARFTNLLTNKSVDVIYDHSSLSSYNIQIKQLMEKLMQKVATPEERKLFGELWQKRVANIFQNKAEVIKVSIVS